MSSNSVRFFPFSPGIPWKLKKGKYILPDVPFAHLIKLLQNKELVVTAFGGLLESYYSLSILEIFHAIDSSFPLFWNGNKNFEELVNLNGLAQVTNIMSPKTLGRFPSPIFFDQENRAYFNCLYNYIDIYTYYLKFGYINSLPLVQQILNNSCVSADYFVFSKLRRLEQPANLSFHLQSNKIDLSLPYILLFPDEGISIHQDVCCLDWSINDIGAFNAMLFGHDIQLIIITHNRQKYFGNNSLKVLPFDLSAVFYLLPQAKAVLSKEIDLLLIANHLSDAMLFSSPQSKPFQLSKNSKFLQKENVIYDREEVDPQLVFNKIKG